MELAFIYAQINFINTNFNITFTVNIVKNRITMGQFSNRNFDVLDEFVGTQYGDLAGLIQIDGHTSLSELYDLCATHGISRDDYLIIGFGFSQFSGLDESTEINCSVLLLKTSNYGETFDQIKEQIKASDTVDVIKKDFYVSLNDIGKCLKRIDAMLLTQMGNYIQNINLIEES